MITAAFGSNTLPDTVARVPCAATRPLTPVIDAIVHKTRHTNFALVMKRRTSLFGYRYPYASYTYPRRAPAVPTSSDCFSRSSLRPAQEAGNRTIDDNFCRKR